MNKAIHSVEFLTGFRSPMASIIVYVFHVCFHCGLILTSETEQFDRVSLKIHTEDNQAYGQFSSLIKFNVEDNPAYGQFTHHMKHPQEH